MGISRLENFGKNNIYIVHQIKHAILNLRILNIFEVFDLLKNEFLLKLMFSKKDTKIEEIYSEDFVNFCGLLRKREL